MSAVMNYKGYYARIEVDTEDRILVGKLAGINDVVTFHADDFAGIEDAFHEAVDDYIATCEKAGKAPERAYSGKVMFRLDPQLHAMLAMAAELAGQSLNQFGEDALAKAVAH